MHTISQQLGRLFAYDHWANTEYLNALTGIEQPPARAVQLLAHIIAAQFLWMERILRRDLAVKVWPDWDPAACAANLTDVASRWARYLEGIAADDLYSIVTYTNSKGERWENTLGDIAMHVANHGTYHRGQIATILRAAGFTPPYTDYIEAIRRRHI